MPADCPLCNVDSPWVFHRDEIVIAYLSEDMACRGHAVVVARQHVENVSQLGREESSGFFEGYRRVEAALLEMFDADRVVGVKLGLAVPHLHFHLYPVSRDVTRAEVDRILAREERIEATNEELQLWLQRLNRIMSDGSLEE